MQKKMILFTKEEILNILNSLKVKIKKEENEELVINPKNNQIAKCECCDSSISLSNIGSVAHGSTKFYCNDPACFSQLVANKKLWG